MDVVVRVLEDTGVNSDAETDRFMVDGLVVVVVGKCLWSEVDGRRN